MNVLIVDDEYYLVEGVKKSVDWKSFSIDSVFTAYSTNQAKDIFLDNQIDILISDIEMPRENGLELIKWVRDNGYNSINILLTGHSNFSYATEGIRLQILDYVLKPVDASTLSPVIDKAVKLCQKNHAETKSRIINNTNILWYRLYDKSILPELTEVSKFAKAYNIPDSILEIPYFYAYLITQSANSFLAITDIKAAVSEYLGENCYVTHISNGRYMLACEWNSPDLKDTSAFKDAIANLDRTFPNTNFKLFLFSEAPMTAAPYALELLEHYAQSVPTTNKSVISINDPNTSTLIEEAKNYNVKLPLEAWEQLLLQEKISDILMDVKTILAHTEDTYILKIIPTIYYGLLSVSFSVLAQKDCLSTEIANDMNTFSYPKNNLYSPDALYEWARSFLNSTCNIMHKENSDESAVIMAQKYIQANISNPDLDRAAIADAVHVSQDYLSYIFHKESGVVLSTYISSARIKEAQKLLLSSKASSSEIAEKCGFSNVSYFHKQFKKFVGMTPNEYRTSKS